MAGVCSPDGSHSTIAHWLTLGSRQRRWQWGAHRGANWQKERYARAALRPGSSGLHKGGPAPNRPGALFGSLGSRAFALGEERRQNGRGRDRGRGRHKQRQTSCLLALLDCVGHVRSCARKATGVTKRSGNPGAIVLSLSPPASLLLQLHFHSPSSPSQPGSPSEAKTIFILLLISGNFAPSACQRRSLAPPSPAVLLLIATVRTRYLPLV